MLIDYLRKVLDETQDPIGELHHGDCIGADNFAHSAARLLGMRVVIHPPKKPDARAWNKGDEMREEKDYLERNKDIVNETDLLIGLPDGPEQLRSGTWSTLRHAARFGHPFAIITTGGYVFENCWPS